MELPRIATDTLEAMGLSRTFLVVYLDVTLPQPGRTARNATETMFTGSLMVGDRRMVRLRRLYDRLIFLQVAMTFTCTGPPSVYMQDTLRGLWHAPYHEMIPLYVWMTWRCGQHAIPYHSGKRNPPSWRPPSPRILFSVEHRLTCAFPGARKDQALLDAIALTRPYHATRRRYCHVVLVYYGFRAPLLVLAFFDLDIRSQRKR
jgi:hypothetical protein